MLRKMPTMKVSAIKTSLQEILPLRNLFLQENNFQIRYNARHERGWSDSYLITHNEEQIGYGSVAGKENISDRDSIFEFYMIPSFRKLASLAFLKLIYASEASFITCQSNDLLLSSLLFEYAQNINADTVLLQEDFTSSLYIDNLIFRKRSEKDIMFEHNTEPVGDYVLELNKEVVATGGFLLHYNMPFADLYMEVREDCRRKGFGSYLIQEIKKQCYLAGRVPAARTGLDNIASRSTLIKAGFKIAGFMLLGTIKK
jgi:GNAT superfamily N-acetyltransferase